MKNNRIKNYLKLVILLFGISALTTSCERDLEIESIELEQSRYKTKNLNKQQIESSIGLNEKLEEVNTNILNSAQYQARGINNEEFGITIFTDRAKYIEDTSNGNHSYSFFIQRNNGSSTDPLENLVLHAKPEGGYNTYIASYDFMANEYHNLNENQTNRLASTFTPIDLDISNFENGIFSRMEYNCTETWGWVSFDTPHDGQLHGADCARPACIAGGSWVMTDWSCGYSDGGGDGSTGNGPPSGGSGNIPNNPGNGNGDGNNNDEGNTTFPVLTAPLDGLDAVELIDIIEQPVSELETMESFKNRQLAVGTYFKQESHVEFSELSDMLLSVVNDPSLEWDDYSYMWNKTKDAYDILKPYTLQIAALDSLDDINTVVPPLLLATAEKNLTTVAFLPQIKSIIGENWPQNAQQWSAIGTIMGQFLLEIGLAVIPGSDIIGVANGFSDGDYLAVTLGYKAEVINGFVKITTNVGNTIAEIQDNVIRFITNGAKSLIKVADLKFLDNVSPSTGGNISKRAIDDNALRIRADNSNYADDIADIMQNGDNGGIGIDAGKKTENLMQDLLAQDGYLPPNQSAYYPSDFDVQLTGGQGFDNVLIKRNTSGNITDIIINKSKQVRSTANITLSSGVVGCGGCTQMSQDWIQYTIDRMNTSGNNNLIQLANEIESFGVSNVTQIVSGVNKNTGELVIVTITGYN